MRPKNLLIAMWMCICATYAQAQQPNPANKPSTGLYLGGTEKPAHFEDYLVQLAIQNNPSLEGLNYEVAVRKAEIKVVRNDWKRNLALSYNLNESNFPYLLKNTLKIDHIGSWYIVPSRVPEVVTYPLWNAGVQLNLGDFSQRKHKIKIAESKQKIAEYELLSRKNKVRTEVIKAWNGFRNAQEVLRVRIQMLDVAEANKVQITELFSVNKAKFEDFSTANKAYYDALESKINAEWEIKTAKAILEEMIGSRWEQIEKVKAAYDELEKHKG